MKKIKALFRLYRYKRFYWKYGGYRNYETYHSGDVNKRAFFLNELYPGYNHVEFFSYPHSTWINYVQADKWCWANCKSKYRYDITRAEYTQFGWTANEFGGDDIISFAFKDERDYIWFMMRWS